MQLQGYESNIITYDASIMMHDEWNQIAFDVNYITYFKYYSGNKLVHASLTVSTLCRDFYKCSESAN